MYDDDMYILDGRTPVKVKDYDLWSKWRRTASRKVKQEEVADSFVSTVFLGMDHSFGDGPPLLFETMVFGGPLSDECDRCSTWEEAEDMHARMVARVSAKTTTTSED